MMLKHMYIHISIFVIILHFANIYPVSAKGCVDVLFPPKCGASIKDKNRIIGGNPADFGAWPWIAAVGFLAPSDDTSIVFTCGGTLISARHVLSAAHCMDFENVTYMVRLGEYNLNHTSNRAIDFEVGSYINHPKFNVLANDISILRLKHNVKFTTLVHPICLPIEGDIRDHDLVGLYPFIAGWGSTLHGGGPSDILREVRVPVVSNSRCKELYATKKKVVIDERVLCAGYPDGGKDACQGDSGGPLMLPYKNTYYLIGIVSNGFSCALAGYPGIYARVSAYLDFILSNMS